VRASQSLRPRVCFFVGPSLPVSEIHAAMVGIDAEIELLPPIQQGDLLRMHERLPDVIGIVDGYFFQVPAVLHKEILYAMERGARVLGASSLGALRAAELDVFGMEGVGEIYRMYKQGIIDGDDEVALVHADEQTGFQSLSQPLVNIRYNLQRARARRLISPRTAAAVVASAKGLPFTQRDYAAILNNTRLDPAAGEEIASLGRFLRDEAVDLKRADALALVRVVAERLRGHQRWPEHPRVRVSRSTFFYDHQREYVGHSVAGQYILDKLVLSFQKLLSPAFPRLFQRVALRCLAVDEALHRGMAGADEEHLVARFRERHDLACHEAYAAWLRERRMVPEELHDCLRERDLEAQLLAVYRSLHPVHLSRAALYRQIIGDVARRVGTSEECVLFVPSLRPGIPWEGPLLRESKLRGMFRAALEWVGPMVQWYAELTKRAPQYVMVVSSSRLEQWAAARWGAGGVFERAVLARGFATQQEFTEVARMAYFAPDELYPLALQDAEQVA
jgi:hypothetical protein